MMLQEVITWLRSIEDLACSIYSEVAESKALSSDIADFFRHLAKDEALHYPLMGSAAELIRSLSEPMQSAVLVDAAAKRRVEQPLRNLRDALAADPADPESPKDSTRSLPRRRCREQEFS